VQPRPITDLVFKGTHNSYACIGQTLPLMGHPPDQQIDDFGVWSVELDFAVKMVDGELRAIVGHDDQDDSSCWGHFLRQYLEAIHAARSRPFRPILFVFDVKDWGDTDPNTARAVGIADLEIVFGAANVVVLNGEELDRHVPTVPELAGKAVLLASNRLPRGFEDECTSREAVNQAITAGTGLEGGCPGIPAVRPAGCRILGIDQYQADWTFEYGVPPNPIIVDATARPPWTVTDVVALPPILQWRCDNGDSWSGQVVHEQGTWRFPYRTLGTAVTRAHGTTPNGVNDPLRSGFGWTVLLTPARYRETLTIDIPLRLEKRSDQDGSVILG
jgi:hypothetical protein